MTIGSYAHSAVVLQILSALWSAQCFALGAMSVTESASYSIIYSICYATACALIPPMEHSHGITSAETDTSITVITRNPPESSTELVAQSLVFSRETV